MLALKQRIRDGYQRFSDGTSMHGFTEFYYAKYIFWTIFWFLILTVALGLTTYQVVKATKQYLDQTTNTVISPATPSDIMFPPLKVCYPHMLYWFNFSKAEAMGLSRNAILFALSYLIEIHSTDQFDVERAKYEFTDFFESKGFGSLRNYFTTAAAHDPFKTQLNFTWSGLLIEEDAIYCEIMDEDGIRAKVNPTGTQLHKRRTSKSTVLNFRVTQPSYYSLGSWFDEKEIANYFYKWLFRNSESESGENENWVKYIAYGMPLAIFPNSYDTDVLLISPDRNSYQVKIKLAVRTYKSTPRVPCVSGYRWTEPNTTCEIKCAKEKFVKLISPPYDFATSAFFEKDVVSNTYGHNFVFSSSNVTIVQNNATTNTNNEQMLWDKTWNECENICCDVSGCQTYTYDSIITSSGIPTLPADTYVISIEYPTEHEVLVMIEQDSQTWEGFVGNVGGLLGIWTGASVLSFIQMFYLCCFTNSDPLWFWKRKKCAVEVSEEYQQKDVSKIDVVPAITK